MMRKKRIAIIGYGAIARDVLTTLQDTAFVENIAVLHRTLPKQIEDQAINHFNTLEALRNWKPDLVIEAAGHEAVRNYVPILLENGFPVLVSSVGALHDDQLFENLLAKAEQGQTRLLLPSGAIGVLDYVRACRFTNDPHIVYESRKPIQAWQKELAERGYDLKTLHEPVVLFEGMAREAARLYPANLNVAATLALAGIGMDHTHVRVVADPSITGNQHHIHIQSDHGQMSVTFENNVSPSNPKSSRIVSKSIVAALQHYFSPCQFL
jgi:aspartate dehydrogenase